MSQLRVSNIKGSFKFEPTSENFIQLIVQNDCENLNLKWYKNFVVLRAKFVYIIFWSSGYVNVTKIRELSDIRQVFEEFSRLTGIATSSKFKIQNIHAFGRLNNIPNLHQCYQKIRDYESGEFTVFFNPSFFHGLKIYNHLGTFLLFQSGNYSFLGCRSMKNLNKLSSAICAVMSKLS